MKSMNYVLVSLMLVLVLSGCKVTERATDKLSEPDPPKQEFRGVWLTSISNLDWPVSNRQSVREQKEDALAILDSLKAIGINAVLFQVRPESDALYASLYDPWSYWLTGEQGRAPDPYFDPLAFFIRESHKRGMELHAWVNPYRVERKKDLYELSGTNVGQREPSWILEFETEEEEHYTMLNPGLPEVRNYVTNVVVDIVRRYDVDGIHLDDYFYPYMPVAGEDSLTYHRFHDNIDEIDDWRRENVNRLVAQIHDSLKTLAPAVAFGISPFAIRKNEDAGTNGLEGYHQLYADARAWLEDRTVDYLTPQLYFETGHESADYASLLGYWSDIAYHNERHLYAGMAPYKMLPPVDWSIEQAAGQLLLNLENGRVQGNIYFRTEHLLMNPKGYADMLREELYRYPAVTPTMPWKSGKKPPEVRQLSASWSEDGRVILTWTEQDPSGGQDSAGWQDPSGGQDSAGGQERTARYAVYRLEPSSEYYERFSGEGTATDSLTVEPVLIAGNLVEVTGQKRFVDRWPEQHNEVVYIVTALSRNSIESDPVGIRAHYDGKMFSYELIKK